MICLAVLLLGGVASSDFESISAQASAAREAGRTAEAIRLYTLGLRLRSQWPEGRWYAGALLYEQNRFGEAAPEFASFVKLKPESAPGWIMLGLCEFRLRRYEPALRHLLRAPSAGLPPSDPLGQAARYHRAIIHTHFARFDAALDELKKFTFPAVDSPSVIQAIGAAAQRLPLLPDEVTGEKRDLVVKTGRAVYDSWAAQTAHADREFRELILSYPENASIRYLYGSFLLQSDTDQALRELNKCLELDPNYLPAMLQIAFEYLARGESAKGIAYAERAAKMQPDSFVPHNALGRLAVAAGELQRGTAELELAVKLAPESPECRFALASAYTKAGRKEEASRERSEFQRLDKLRSQAAGP